jgi:acetoin utilization protein AcuC
VQPASPGSDQPLVVYGPSSHLYDFGPQHPLSPRRFAVGIDLLQRLGAERFLTPQVASDAELQRVHDPQYVAAVRMLSEFPAATPMLGFAPLGDDPPFRGMHEAAATVAGGTLAAMDRILAGEAVHAFHPGGGLHHAMRDRASGFCIYNDVALAVARARDAGHRVLYVDLDVHHGDGVEAAFWDDRRVLTVSFHETGRRLFPGTGFVDDCGGGDARGRAVNVPLEPGTSDASWLAAVELVVPALAAAFRPTLLVSQHGSDTHVLDPLAHLALTTRAMAAAAQLLDRLAHRYTEGRWLATGGGGYDVYRVVPRAWALIWLAQAHREVPAETPREWRARWAADAVRYRQAPPPVVFLDPADLATTEGRDIAERNREAAGAALACSLRALGEGAAA